MKRTGERYSAAALGKARLGAPAASTVQEQNAAELHFNERAGNGDLAPQGRLKEGGNLHGDYCAKRHEEHPPIGATETKIP